MAKMKEQPIPADLAEMTYEQLSRESDRYDYGDLKAMREALVEQRDSAQEKLSAMVERRHHINRAMIALLDKKK